MLPELLTYENTAGALNWIDTVEALRAGHLLPKAEVGDVFLGPATATLLSRSAYIPGLGYGVKAVTVMDANPARGLPTVQGAMMLYDPDGGTIRAIIDSRLITEFKTAGDSVLGASLLARPDSRHLLVIGAGTLAGGLVRAYSAYFPEIEKISIWARRPEQAQQLVAELDDVRAELVACADLQAAVAEADIISTATMAREPVLPGAWVRPGTHVDLIGAYKADMREADDTLIERGMLFVDSRDTTIHHIGELMMPIAAGVITEQDVRGDLYDLVSGAVAGRHDPEDITVFKNGGGAHLDLMTAAYITKAVG